MKSAARGRWLGACALMFAGAVATAQPEPVAPPPVVDQPDGRGDPGAQLERELAMLKARQTKLEEARRRISAGERPRDVLRELDLLRRGERDDGGPPEGLPGRRSFGPRGEGPRGEGPREGGFPGEGRRGPEFMDKPESREAIEAFLQEHAPEVAKRLREARESTPELADRMWGRVAPRVRDAMNAGKRDPELVEPRMRELTAGMHVLDALVGFRQAQRVEGDAKTAAVEAARTKLRTAMGEVFDARLMGQEAEVQILSRRLDQMRSGIDKAKTDRERKLDSLLKEIDQGREPDLEMGNHGPRRGPGPDGERRPRPDREPGNGPGPDREDGPPR